MFLAGLIEVSDVPRPEASACVQALHNAGAEVWMVTGDNRRTAFACARAVGILPSHVLAEALPSNKIQHVKQLQHAGHVVAFVGDGINDSPALAQVRPNSMCCTMN
jgi:Cu+-exporting ATPase